LVVHSIGDPRLHVGLESNGYGFTPSCSDVESNAHGAIPSCSGVRE
jgi:hypothetical protein